jgi:hypothetical protein
VLTRFGISPHLRVWQRCAGSLIVKGSHARARAWLLAANLGASHASALQRFFQLSLRDRLLPKYAFEEPFKGFHPGCQLRILALGQSCLYLTEASWPSQVGQRPKVNGAASEPPGSPRTGESIGEEDSQRASHLLPPSL